jgi:hypothetical protein
MRRLGPFLASGVLTFGLGFAVLGTAPRPCTGTESVSQWLMDYNTAKTISQHSKKPIMLVIR